MHVFCLSIAFSHFLLTEFLTGPYFTFHEGGIFRLPVFNLIDPETKTYKRK